MWIEIIVVFLAIKLSEERCDRFPDFSRSYMSYSYFMHKLVCSGITSDYDINDHLKLEAVDRDVIIERSKLPELTGKMFQNISVKTLKIEAEVTSIRSKTFENSKIIYLNLDDNHVNEIEDWSFNSSSIERIGLRSNNLTHIKTNTFYGLQALKELYLKYNSITDIEENSFNSLTKLVTLDLSFNKLSKLESQLFKNLTNLEMIYLNNNQLTKLDDMFYNCENLNNLYIQNNLITRLEGKGYPHSLVSIDAKNNTLKSIQFPSLPNIKTVDFSFNRLTSIADWSPSLLSVEELRLNHNLIGPFIDSKAVQHMKNLTIIEMDDNSLRNIDIELLNSFSKLKQISLARNLLENFTISDFGVHLTSLNLSGNHLNEVKNLSIMQDLKTLDLSHNNLQEIKFNTFDHLSKVTYLHLEYNAIHTIHMGCFKDLKSVENLVLSHNQISVVDTGSFSGANALTVLDISYNNLTHLDENVFHNLKQLVKLSVAYNNLKNAEIKTLMSHTPSLKEIDLAGNKWSCSLLVELLKGKIWLTPGSAYNVTNILGIPCTKNNSVPTTQSESLVKASVYYDSVQEISSKVSVSNVVLIILLILLCIKFLSGTCVSGYNATRRYFDQKYKNEQEMQLI